MRTQAPDLVTNLGTVSPVYPISHCVAAVDFTAHPGTAYVHATLSQAEAKLEEKQAEFDKLKENTLQLFVDVNAENFDEIHQVSPCPCMCACRHKWVHVLQCWCVCIDLSCMCGLSVAMCGLMLYNECSYMTNTINNVAALKVWFKCTHLKLKDQAIAVNTDIPHFPVNSQKIVEAEKATTPLLSAIEELKAEVQGISGEISGYTPLAIRLQLLQSVMFEFLALSAQRIDIGAPAPSNASHAMDTSSRYLQTCELFASIMVNMEIVIRSEPLAKALQVLAEAVTKQFYVNTTVALHLSDRPLFSLLMCVRLLEAQGDLDPSELLCLWKLKFQPELFQSGSAASQTKEVDTAIEAATNRIEDEVTVTERSPIASLGDMMWLRLKHVTMQLKPQELVLK